MIIIVACFSSSQDCASLFNQNQKKCQQDVGLILYRLQIPQRIGLTLSTPVRVSVKKRWCFIVDKFSS